MRPSRAAILPAALGRVHQRLRSAEDGDRQMVKILAAVLTDGLQAVQVACAEALGAGLCNSDVVLNVLSRQRPCAPATTIAVPDALVLQHAPLADCTRYDNLRSWPDGAP